MYKQIKQLADEAIALQNKDRMDAALRQISDMADNTAPTGQALVGWRSMDTSRAEQFSDQTLIEQIEHMSVTSGWGLLAELLKRFNRMSGAEVVEYGAPDEVSNQLADAEALTSSTNFGGGRKIDGEAKFEPGKKPAAKKGGAK